MRVLGPFEVEGDDGLLALGSARRRALLALLTLNAGRVVGAERLVDALWGESPPRTATHVLQVYVSDLRQVLPDDVLVTASPGYVLRLPADAVDLTEFERLLARGRMTLAAGDPAAAAVALDAALSLWRGPVLEDLAHEGFVQVEARRLEELRLAAREMRATAALSVGEDGDLVADLLSLVAEHPFRERSHALLMRTLAAQGRQADALEVFAAVRTRLSDELGIEPGQELRAAQAAVLRQDVLRAELPQNVPSVAAGVVVAVGRDPARLSELARTASCAATAAGRELVTVAMLDAASTDSVALPAAAAAAAAAQRSVPGPGRSAAFRSRDLAGDLAVLAAEHDADLVVLDAAGLIGPQGLLAGWVVAALSDLTADVALLPGTTPPAGASFVVPFGGSEHDWAAAELAALLVRRAGTSLRVVGAMTDDDDGSRLVARVGLAVQRAVGITVEPALAEPTVPALLAAMAGSAAVVGVSERWRSEGLGRFRQQLADAMPGTLVVRRGVRAGLLAPRSSHTRFAWSAIA